MVNRTLIAPKDTSIKRSLILAGGGMRLAYQAGVLQALLESELQFTHVDGTSGGIFNTAMLASGLSPEEMADRWRNVKVKNFMSYRPVKEYFILSQITAFGDADGIREKVFPQLGIDLRKINANDAITATFNVCHFATKSVEAITHEQVTEDHLIAGMSLPIFMPAIKIKNDWYTDAVWIKDANLMEAVRRGAEELWLVWAIGNNTEYLPGSFNQYVHMIEMSANGGLLEEYAQIKLINERIVKGDSPYGQKKAIRLFVIKPVFPLPLDPDLFFDKINTDTLINMGYADAKKYLAQIPYQEISFDSSSTQMKDPGVTLTFRQKFKGELIWHNKKMQVCFSPFFSLRRHNELLSLQFNSSISISDKYASTRSNLAALKKVNDLSRIEITAEFDFDNDTYLLRGILPLSSAIDWILGLEFKRMEIELIKKSSGEQWMKGFLRQGIGSRFKNIFNTALRNFYGEGSKIKQKYSMISKLYMHEI